MRRRRHRGRWWLRLPRRIRRAGRQALLVAVVAGAGLLAVIALSELASGPGAPSRPPAPAAEPETPLPWR